jgi:hypothetical protein
MSVGTPVTSDSRRQLALWLLCAALGVAVLSTLAAAQTRSQHPAGANTAAALAAGYHLAVGAGLGGAAIVVAAAVLWPSRRGAALAECC